MESGVCPGVCMTRMGEGEPVMGKSWSCTRSWRKAPLTVGVYVPGGGSGIVVLESDGVFRRGNLWIRGGLN